MDIKEFEAITQFLKTRRHNISLPYYDSIRNDPQYATIDDPQLDPATRKKLRKSRRNQLKNAKKDLKTKANIFEIFRDHLTILRNIWRPISCKLNHNFLYPLLNEFFNRF
jgi:hypothetical protein